MPALTEIDLGTLTPEQRAAAMLAITALERLRAENEALAGEKACLAGENEAKAERIRRLEHLVRELQRVVHGKRSEKLTADERQLAFEDLEGASAEVEAEAPAGDPPPPRSPKRPRAARNIGHLPEHLERIEQVIEPGSTLCPCGCGEMMRIGEDRSERLDIVPAQLRVIVTVRPKYACRSCEQGVVQAPAPARLIEGGLPTEGAIAHVLVSKYSEHCPLYRQVQIYARSGLDLDRSTLAGWVGKASFHLRPVVDRLAEHLKRSSKLFMDETRALVLDPGRGRTKTGWLWALARDDRAWGGPDPPGVVYFYAGYNRLTGRSREGGAPHIDPSTFSMGKGFPSRSASNERADQHLLRHHPARLALDPRQKTVQKRAPRLTKLTTPEYRTQTRLPRTQLPLPVQKANQTTPPHSFHPSLEKAKGGMNHRSLHYATVVLAVMLSHRRGIRAGRTRRGGANVLDKAREFLQAC